MEVIRPSGKAPIYPAWESPKEIVELTTAIIENVIDYTGVHTDSRLDKLLALVAKITEKLVENNILSLDELNEISWTDLKPKHEPRNENI